MTGKPPKVHLVRSGSGRNRIAACGQRNPLRYTHEAEEVNCGACRQTLFMADAEVRKARGRRNR